MKIILRKALFCLVVGFILLSMNFLQGEVLEKESGDSGIDPYGSAIVEENVCKTVKNHIVRGEFQEIKKYLHQIDAAELKELLFIVGSDERNVCAYSFISWLLLQQETKELHCLAVTVMLHCFPHINGSYETALYHIRRAIELRPEDIELQGMLLFLHEIPDSKDLLSCNEVRRVATNILEKDPNNTCAKNALIDVEDEEWHRWHGFIKDEDFSGFDTIYRIKKLILKGEFLEAYKWLQDISQDELCTFFFKIGYDDINFCTYAFVCFLLLKGETAELHALAAQIILQNPLGVAEYRKSYWIALYHTRRGLELEPENMELQVNLLSFSKMPENFVSDEEAEKLAASVLEKDSDNFLARKILFGESVAQRWAETKRKAENKENSWKFRDLPKIFSKTIRDNFSRNP